MNPHLPATRALFFLFLLTALTLSQGSANVRSAPDDLPHQNQFDIFGPPGSSRFGTSVTVLPNGNIVVTDPHYNSGYALDVGAVYLYNNSGEQISMLTGSNTNDMVGSDGVEVLSNGNYVVISPNWNMGGGAVTWGNGTSGIAGTVSALNSLVGRAADHVGSNGVIVLNNGNYVVGSPNWGHGRGAATWGSGISGIVGTVSNLNSLVGSDNYDQVGSVHALGNGNYVVCSSGWDNGSVINAGAATWGDGTSGVSGTVSALNSLVGTMPGDWVCAEGITDLSSANYIVNSPDWNDSRGAVTWGSGSIGVSGAVSASNSLVGSITGDSIGAPNLTGGVIPVNNGNYLVISVWWDNGSQVNAGAVTWGNGSTGITGTVSASNSITGWKANDHVGSGYVYRLSNGNYVVASPDWDRFESSQFITDAGAATWGNGAIGTSGSVSVLNSLVGSKAGDAIGDAIFLLSNGNYVVSSPSWDDGAIIDAGAVTWGNGLEGVKGEVSYANSLVGNWQNDQIGDGGVAALSNGNYVVKSPFWGVHDIGAVTWGDGNGGTTGSLNSDNSFVGSFQNDKIGSGGVFSLSNGNFVVVSPLHDNSGTEDIGAITWGNGTSGLSGWVTNVNSLLGSTAGDQVGMGGVAQLSNSNFVVISPSWDNGPAQNAGAATWGSGNGGISGTVSPSNSLVGSHNNDRVGGDFWYEDVIPLTNGNYLVKSVYWDNGLEVNTGAITWGNGSSGVKGEVSALNSLVGSTAEDQVGSGGMVLLSDDNYVVISPIWDNGSLIDAGAVTWGNGTKGLSGPVSSFNSLVGSHAGDIVGDWCMIEPPFDPGFAVLSSGDYIVFSCLWDNGAVEDAGAVTWGFRTIGAAGPMTMENSVRGSTAGGGSLLVFQYSATNNRLVVGRPADNIVTIFTPTSKRYLPLISK